MYNIDLTNPSIPITDASITYKSLEASVLSLSIPITSQGEQSPLPTTETYRITTTDDNGIKTTRLVGTVTNTTRTLSASGQPQWSIEISDYMHLLSLTTWLGYNNTLGTVSASYSLKSLARSSASSDEGDQVIRLSTALTAVLNGIPTKHIPIKYKVNVDDASYLIPFGVNNSKITELLDEIRTWEPRLASYMLYEDDASNPEADPSVTLVVTTKHNARTLDAKADPITDIDLTPRPDLIPPCVGVIASALTKTNAVIYTRAVYPKGGDITAPGAQLITTTLSSDTTDDDGNTVASDPVQEHIDFSAPSVTLTGKSLPTDQDGWAQWWTSHVPALAGAKIRTANTWTVEVQASDASDTVGGYVDEVLKYEWLSGEYNGKAKGIHWTEVLIKQRIICKDPDLNQLQLFPLPLAVTEDGKALHNNFVGEFSALVRLIDRHKCKYYLDHDMTVEDGDSDDDTDTDPSATELSDDNVATVAYNKLAKAYYEANSVLQYQGSISLKGTAPLVYLPGDTICIDNDNPAYADMSTTLQEYTWDVVNNSHTLTTGPANVLSLSNAQARANAIYKQQEISSDDATGSESQAVMSSTGGEQYTMPQRERPSAPTIGPLFRLLPHGGTPPRCDDLHVKPSYTCAGVLDGAHLKSGWVITPDGSATSAEQSWTSVGNASNYYLDVDINTDGHICVQPATQRRAIEQDPHIYAVGMRYLSGGGYAPQPGCGDKWDIRKGQYSYHIATMDQTTGKVTQHQQGPIVIPYSKRYILYQVTDCLHDNNGRLIASCNDNNTSDQATASLLYESCMAYARLRYIQAGCGVSLCADGPKLVLSASSCATGLTDAYTCNHRGACGASLIADSYNEDNTRYTYLRSILGGCGVKVTEQWGNVLISGPKVSTTPIQLDVGCGSWYNVYIVYCRCDTLGLKAVRCYC